MIELYVFNTTCKSLFASVVMLGFAAVDELMAEISVGASNEPVGRA